MLSSLEAKWEVFVQMQGAKTDLSYGDVWNAMLLEYERRAAMNTDVKMDHKALNSAIGTGREGEKNWSCFYCRKRGNVIRDCRKRLADSKMNGFVDEKADTVTTDDNAVCDNKYDAVCFYSSSTPRIFKHTWIVNSGASAPMNPHREHLTDFRKVHQSCSVKFGNGR